MALKLFEVLGICTSFRSVGQPSVEEQKCTENAKNGSR